MRPEPNAISCAVCRDLAPLVADGVASADSAALVRAHLAACPSCAAEWPALAAETGAPPAAEPPLPAGRDGARVLRTILRLYRDYQPMRFFGAAALFLTLLAAVFFFPVLLEYLKTGLVPRFPTLIICGFCAIAALLSLFTGMILQTLAARNRQDFEYRLIQAQKDLARSGPMPQRPCPPAPARRGSFPGSSAE